MFGYYIQTGFRLSLINRINKLIGKRKRVIILFDVFFLITYISSQLVDIYDHYATDYGDNKINQRSFKTNSVFNISFHFTPSSWMLPHFHTCFYLLNSFSYLLIIYILINYVLFHCVWHVCCYYI